MYCRHVYSVYNSSFSAYFSGETVFFSHNKSVNGVFQPAYQHRRTAPASSDATTPRCQALCIAMHFDGSKTQDAIGHCSLLPPSSGDNKLVLQSGKASNVVKAKRRW
jgi:hypothetical protein